jgi:hypothetical protein
MDLVAAEPHEIVLIFIDTVRDAPLYFSVIKQKASAGWICGKLPKLDQTKRFADRLAGVGPNLMYAAEDRSTLRELRSCGRGIWKVCHHSCGMFFEVMGKYTNSLARTAGRASTRIQHTA